MEEVHSSDSDGLSQTRFGVSDEHVSKLSEVYSCIGSITVFVAAGIFIIWGYVPDYWLEFVGIHYYPNRYWSLAVPSYVMVTIVVAIAFLYRPQFFGYSPSHLLEVHFRYKLLLNWCGMVVSNIKICSSLLLCTCADEYGEDLLNLSGIPVTDDGEPLPNSTDSVHEMVDGLKSSNPATDEPHDMNQTCGIEVGQYS